MGVATGLPFYDGFETYVAGTSLTNGPNGWGASPATVVVQTNVVWSPALGTNAVMVPPEAVVSNVLVSADRTNVWSDFCVTNSVAMPVEAVGPDAVNTNLAVQWFVETNGFPVVWHPASNAWLVCSNDYWGTPAAVFNTNAWMRFTVCADYSNQTAAVFLNQHLLLQQVRFINTNLTLSGRFQVNGGYSVTSYIDEVSVRYTPTNSTVDLDHDGMADADEIQLYGSVDIRHWPVITVIQPANGSISPSGSYAVWLGSTTNFILHTIPAYVVSQVLTNGQSVGSFTGQNTRDASYSWVNISPDGLSDGVFSATITYSARRYVPQDYLTVIAAMAEALPGDTLIVSNGSYSGDVTLGNGVTVVGTNVVLAGNLTVAAGTTGTVWASTGLGISGITTVDGFLMVSNGSVNLGTVVFGAAGAVQVVNAAAVVLNGVTYSGSFTLDATSSQVVLPQTLPFSDDFERYATNPATVMAQMGHFGWGASDSGIVVQGAMVTQGFKAVEMPLNTILSNSLAPAASSNVWVEWSFRESDRIDESLVDVSGTRTNMAVILFVNTNNYVTVYNPETSSFNVLSNDVLGQPVAKLSISDWPRISVNVNYRTRKAAVLLNGRVLVQQLRFINTNQANCARLECDAGTAGSTYLDAVNFWTNAVSILSADADGNGVFDALEIDANGYAPTAFFPNGSIFKIR
jgi:hypothetical protein